MDMKIWQFAYRFLAAGYRIVAPKKSILIERLLKVSQATIMTVLVRFVNVWVKRSGLLPEDGDFTGDATTNRNQMAVMLEKYLVSVGKDATLPAELVSFADAETMAQEGNDAFQVLYRYGISEE